jgi:phage-related protein
VGGIIAGLVALWITNLGGFRDWITGAFSVIGETLSPIFDDLKQAFADLQPELAAARAAMQPVLDFLGKVFMFLLKVIGWVLGFAFAAIIGVITGIVGGLSRGIQFFMQIFAYVVAFIATLVKGVIDIFSGLIDFFTGLFTGNWELMWNGLITFLTGIWEIIIGLLGAILSMFITIFMSIAAFLAGFIETVINFFVNLYNKLVGNSIIIDMLTGIWTAFTDWLSMILGYVGQWILDVIAVIFAQVATFIQTGVDIITGLLSGIEIIFLGAVGIIAKVGQWIADTIAKIVESLPIWIQTGIDIITNFLKGLTDTFFAPGTGVVDKMKQYIQDVIDAIVKKIDDWKTLGKDIITGILDGLKANAVQLTTYLTGVIKALIASILKLLGIGPHSPLFAGVGTTILDDILDGMNNHIQNFADNMTGSLMDAISGVEVGVNTSGILDMVNQNTARTVTPSYGNSVSNNSTRNINIQVNPNYSNIQSEAGIYYDITAALHAVNL